MTLIELLQNKKDFPLKEIFQLRDTEQLPLIMNSLIESLGSLYVYLGRYGINLERVYAKPQEGGWDVHPLAVLCSGSQLGRGEKELYLMTFKQKRPRLEVLQDKLMTLLEQYLSRKVKLGNV